MLQILIWDKQAAKSTDEVTNENLAATNPPYITLTWMLHELLIYSIKTCYDCITIYLSISDNPGWLPWGFSHIQSQPLWHTLLSLFKYPVTSPSGPGTQRHVIKSSISPQPRLPSCTCGDGLIFFGRGSTARSIQLNRLFNLVLSSKTVSFPPSEDEKQPPEHTNDCTFMKPFPEKSKAKWHHCDISAVYYSFFQ